MISYGPIGAAFAYGTRSLGYTSLTQARIDTGDAAPVSTPPYRVSPEGRKFIEEEVARLLANDVIEEADSPWASNIVLIKQHSKIRFCVDYRKVNEVLRTDQYRLPRIDDYLSQFEGKRFFSTFDANAGFNQVEITEEDRPKTAFRTPIGLFQYNCMPFGLKNGPSIFQRCMDKTLGNAKWDYAVVYLDDIIIYSADFDMHLKHLESFLHRIIPTGFTLSLKKSHVCYSEVQALGHRVGRLGIGMKKENVRAILEFPAPRNVKELMTFLGMAGYYRRFIKSYSMIAKPLTNLLSKGTPWEWSAECQAVFETLRAKLCEEPVLAHPDYAKPFIIYTDGSYLGIGAVLAQTGEDRREHIICTASRTLAGAESRYAATELECLAMVWALRKFHLYIDGVPQLKLVTDHSALQWIMDYKGTNACLRRWTVDLQEFRDKIKIIHRPGKPHSNVDALSRAPVPETHAVMEAESLIVSCVDLSQDFLQDLRDGYLSDNHFAAIADGLAAGKSNRHWENYVYKDGVLFYRHPDRSRLLICVPNFKTL